MPDWHFSIEHSLFFRDTSVFDVYRIIKKRTEKQLIGKGNGNRTGS